MNELMNYKGVLRTAPATLGLVNTDIYYHPSLHCLTFSTSSVFFLIHYDLEGSSLYIDLDNELVIAVFNRPGVSWAVLQTHV